MWLSELSISGIKVFREETNLDFSKSINLIVGPNNFGKSTILKSIYSIQKNPTIPEGDLSIGLIRARILMKFREPDKTKIFTEHFQWNSERLELGIETSKSLSPSSIYQNQFLINFDGNQVGSFSFYKSEPNNFIYPYFSNRKVVIFDEAVNQNIVNTVSGDFRNLYAKIDRLSSPDFPNYDEFVKACLEIIGYRVSSVPSENGKKPALIIDKHNIIPLSAMGEGIVNILGLITDIFYAENQLFLIEELENDIHPKALKALLSLIELKSSQNQFIISTHSNIVVKLLGSNSSTKIFKLNSKFEGRIPVSNVSVLGESYLERVELLEDLGYDFVDFGLWAAWLILEESSAEWIIREYLIPNFVPELKNKLKTYSANGIDFVKNKFETYNKLFVFIHLEPAYKNKAWVVIDNGLKEEKIIKDLQSIYEKNGWKTDRFRIFEKHDFEEYYPNRFSENIQQIKNLKHDMKRESKKELLNNVKEFIKENPIAAKEEFEISAFEVINLLKEIRTELNP